MHSRRLCRRCIATPGVSTTRSGRRWRGPGPSAVGLALCCTLCCSLTPPPVLCLCISRLILEVVWVCGISGAAGGEVHITHPLYIRLLHGSVALSEAPPPGPPPARGGVASLVNGGLDERIAGERGTEDTVVSTLVR